MATRRKGGGEGLQNPLLSSSSATNSSSLLRTSETSSQLGSLRNPLLSSSSSSASSARLGSGGLGSALSANKPDGSGGLRSAQPSTRLSANNGRTTSASLTQSTTLLASGKPLTSSLLSGSVNRAVDSSQLSPYPQTNLTNPSLSCFKGSGSRTATTGSSLLTHAQSLSVSQSAVKRPALSSTAISDLSKGISSKTDVQPVPTVSVPQGKSYLASLPDVPPPEYSLPAEHASDIKRFRQRRFKTSKQDAKSTAVARPLVDIQGMKMSLINAAAGALIRRIDFHNRQDKGRLDFISLASAVIKYDAEFLLKVAVYTRRELNVRTVANFMLATAGNFPACRPFLAKYFAAAVRLPSDWIDVAELYQSFHDKSLMHGSLPTALRRAMIAKFPEFDEYQLAKYNKDKSKLKKKKEKRKSGKMVEVDEPKPQAASLTRRRYSHDDEDEDDEDESSDNEDKVVPEVDDGEDEEELERLSFTLKQLIRKLHISEPVYHVMCLLGKKYPDDLETFYKNRLPGMFDPDRAGKRMKLKVPETWETQVSMRGNKAVVWEELIDHRKLPFMAMLRNLRNMILAGISAKHHNWVLRKLTDQGAVISSKQFPFRFFSAYEVLGEVGKIARGEVKKKPTLTKKPGKKLLYYKKEKKIPEINQELLDKYRGALDTAVKIATRYNIVPIRGTTVLFCNLSDRLNRPCTSARGLGKPRTVKEIGVLLGLMCQSSCEQCLFYAFEDGSASPVPVMPGMILENMDRILEQSPKGASFLGGSDHDIEESFPVQLLNDMLIEHKQIDNILVLSDTMILGSSSGHQVQDFLRKYRRLVNPNLLFVSVDLSGSKSGFDESVKPEHPNDIFIAGFSDQILRFIAERGEGAQLAHVENIDKAFDLSGGKHAAAVATADVPAVEDNEVEPGKPRPLWRTARVFISSTFRDMHGERDILTRYVFPELRARARRRRINVFEVDLRWGVTEEETKKKKALEVCLDEVSRCNFFIGLLGERYGWCAEEYHVPDDERYDWVREYPSGRSVTELEMQHAALGAPQDATGRAFFYFRDQKFFSDVPSACAGDFRAESDMSEKHMAELKSRIRTSGLEVYDGYPCSWGGVVDGKPMVVGLETFGSRVLEQLWNAIQRCFPDEDEKDDSLLQERVFHSAFAEHHLLTFSGRRNLLRQCQTAVNSCKEGGVLLLKGAPGSGKSSLMAAFLHQFSSDTLPKRVVAHYCGAAPRSTQLPHLLRRYCRELKRQCRLTVDLPENIQELVAAFSAVLVEAVTAVGSGGHVLLALDGADLLDDALQARNLDWLPDPLPKGVIFVTSANDGGTVVQALSRRQQKPVDVVVLSGLDVFEKSEMVRKTLARHHKTLDESPFNNQMKLLVSKKDATSPLFLSLACEELRVFGIFEKVSDELKRMPSKLPQLLQEVLARLERDHDKHLVTNTMLFLASTRQGLLESELHGVLSLFLMMNKPVASVKEAIKLASSLSESPQRLLPSTTFARLLRGLQGFLLPTGQGGSDSCLVLAHHEILVAIRQRYLRISADQVVVHRLLAGFFWELAQSEGDTWISSERRALSELPYHLAACGSWAELGKVLCDLSFLQAKASAGLAADLLLDFSIEGLGNMSARQQDVTNFLAQHEIQEFRSFLSRNMHIIAKVPSLLCQQAANEPTKSPVAKAAVNSSDCDEVVRWLNKLEHLDPCEMTVSNAGQVVSCVAVSPDNQLMACGGLDCSVKVYSLSTGKEVQSFVGHASAVSSCCFVGIGRLCTASQDGRISLWDLSQGHRIAVLQGHQRRVGGCAADQAGKVLVSVGWDCKMFVWDGTNGQQLSMIAAADCPISCVSFHPEGQRVVIGCWDSNLQIWDTFNKKRLRKLRGHTTSVRTAAYSPSGRHIASASLDGEVRLWSVRAGSSVGKFMGHALPINQLCFTPTDHLITVSNDWQVKVWSSHLGQLRGSCGASKAERQVTCVRFHKFSTNLVIGRHDGSVSVEGSGGNVYHEVKVHTATVTCVAVLKEAKTPEPSSVLTYVSGSDDSTLQIICSKGGDMTVGPQLVGHEKGITSVAVSERMVASTSHDFTARLWSRRAIEANKAEIKASAVLRGHTAPATCCCFSHLEDFLFTGGRDMNLFVWNVSSGEMLRSISTGHKDWINDIAYTDLPGAEFLVTCSNDFTLKVFNTASGEEKVEMTGHTAAVTSVSYKAGCVVSGCADGSVKVWSQKGVEITTLSGHSKRVNSVDILTRSSRLKAVGWAISEQQEEEEETSSRLDDVLVVSGSDDCTVHVWNPFLGNEVASMTGHSDRVLSVATSGDGQLVSSSLDKTVKVWKPKVVESIDSLAGTLSHHSNVVTGLGMWPDQKAAVSIGRDGSVIFWKLQVADEGSSAQHLTAKAVHRQQMTRIDQPVDALTALCVLAKQQASVLSFFVADRCAYDGVEPGINSVIHSCRWDNDKELLDHVLIPLTQRSAPVSSMATHHNLLAVGYYTVEESVVLFEVTHHGASVPCSLKKLQVLQGAQSDWVTSVVVSPFGQVLALSASDRHLVLWKNEAEESRQSASASLLVKVKKQLSSDDYLSFLDTAVGFAEGGTTLDGWRNLLADYPSLIDQWPTQKKASAKQQSPTKFDSATVGIISHSVAKKARPADLPWGLCLSVAGDDMKTAFAGDSDGYLTVFDLAVPAKRLLCEKIHEDALSAINGIGRYITTGSADGMVKIWLWQAEEGDKLLQLGQFSCGGPVTSLHQRYTAQRQLQVMAGTSLGEVLLLLFSVPEEV